MRCQSCDRLLTAYESTLKNATTYKYLDLCKTCFEDVKPFVSVIDRKDLITEADLDNDDDDDLDTKGFDEDIEDLAHFLQYSNDNSNDF